MVTIFILICLFVVLALAVLATMGGKEEKRIARKTEFLLHEIDQKYADFITKSINLAVIQQNKSSLEIEQISQKVHTILKPEIDGLIAFINASNYTNIPVNHSSTYFKGAASLASSLFKIAGNTGKRLSQEDEQKFHQAFKDAIQADLTQRFLDLNTNNYLSAS